MTDQIDRSKQLRDLETLLEVTRQLAATIDLDALLKAIEQAARQVLRCERATVFLYEPETAELVSRIATGVAEIRFPADRGIAGYVARTGCIVNVPDAYADDRFNPEIDRQTGFRTCNILAVPMYDFSGRLMGVLQALNKRGGCFDTYDEWLAGILSAQAGVALQRQRLLLEYAEKQRMQRDLDIARSIQQQLLPKASPTIEGWDIAGWNQPADETGGDCFDFFQRRDGSLAVSLADATGHGIGPALVIAECRALLRATLDLQADLSEVLRRVNRLLCCDLPSDRFVTAFVAVVSPGSGLVRYISAGQGPLLVVTNDGAVEQYPTTSIPLGIMPDADFEAGQPIDLSSGDLLAVVTDGLFEWQSDSGEEFGPDRLASTLAEFRQRPAQDIITALYERVRVFTGATRQRDDITVVILKRL